jgi:predicted metal-dependent phosphoesterase TrpH
MTPEELIVYAKKKGLEAVAITDHDTVDGVSEAFHHGKRLGLEVISGIEISAIYETKTVHILGYLFDMKNEVFLKAIDRLQKARIERNEKILQLLANMGIHVVEEEVAAVSKIGQTGRPHIARVLIDRGVVKNIDEAFGKYLGDDGCAYVRRFVFSVTEVLELIHQAGGVAVLAHPMQLVKKGLNLDSVIGTLVKQGLDGIELYYPTHSKKTRALLSQFAEQYNLVVSGGSDYHGEMRPGTTLAGGKNVTVPGVVLSELKERASDF